MSKLIHIWHNIGFVCLIAFVLPLMPADLTSQSSDLQHYKELISRAYKTANDTTVKTAHLEMAVMITNRDSVKNKNQYYDTQMDVHGKEYHMCSQGFEIYQNDKTAVVVNSNQKTVYLRSIHPTEVPKGIESMSIGMPDSILKNMFVQSSRSITEDGEQRLEVVLIPTPKTLKTVAYEKITYVLRDNNTSIQRVFVEFKKTEPALHMLCIYRKYVRNLDASTLSSISMYNNVVDSKDRLMKKYSNYTLYDYRHHE